jgi:hypothetical protein
LKAEERAKIERSVWKTEERNKRLVGPQSARNYTLSELINSTEKTAIRGMPMKSAEKH